MLSKLRRNSKQLLETRRSNSQTASLAPTLSRQDSKRSRCTFFDLPAELRIAIYEDVARETSISIPLRFVRKGQKPPSTTKISRASVPSLLVVSKQSRRDFLPILLAHASVRVTIKDFEFRVLVRMLESLYIVELKALRANTRLHIQLSADKCNRDSIVSLRRWLDNRSSGLDRLPWNYRVCWGSKYAIDTAASAEKASAIKGRRREVLDHNLEAIALLHKNLGEHLQFELAPIIEAFEHERGFAPMRRDWDELVGLGEVVAMSGSVCMV